MKQQSAGGSGVHYFKSFGPDGTQSAPMEPPVRLGKSTTHVIALSGSAVELVPPLSTMPGQSVADALKFEHLVNEFRRTIGNSSRIRDLVFSRPYQRIMAMGYSALPFLFEELRRCPDFWFYALENITDENPVPEEEMGNVGLMTQRWLAWAAANGYSSHVG